MKVPIIVFSLALLLSIKINAQTSFDEVIGLTYDYGDGTANTLIGSNEKSITKAYQSDQIDPFRIKKIILRRQVIKYISKYISGHCDTVNRRKQGDFYLYIVRSFNAHGYQNCFIIGKPSAKEYYQGMKAWINRSPYKKECKELLKIIDFYAR